MRLIDADKVDFNEVFVGASDFARETREAAKRLIDMQPTVINGKVTNAEHAYQRITYVHPTKHHYEEPGEEPYIKYSCPVCEAVGNRLSITQEEKTCPLCGVNPSLKHKR